MQEISSRHDIILREAIEINGGHVVKTMGDGFHAVFRSATEAMAAGGLCSLDETVAIALGLFSTEGEL